jgi:hypothetical protein
MRCYYTGTRTEIKKGDLITSFRGETFEVTYLEPPKHSGSTGRIYVCKPGERNPFGPGYFPSVFNAEYRREYCPAPSA